MKTKMKPKNMKCPYCGKTAVLRKASYVYKERALDEYLYVCSRYPACDSYVGVHAGTLEPKGSLANGDLRHKRIETHRLFDAIWKNGIFSRKDAYRWIQDIFCLTDAQAHIGQEFYEKERELHVLSEEEFDQYLNRLLQRKLVVCGEDYVGVDALYALIGHLQLQAVPNSIPVKLLTFVKLLLSRKVPLKTALCIFHSVRLDPLESQVMQLLKNQDLSAAEVILCNENHISHLKDSTALMEALYNDEKTDYNTLVTSARTSSSRIPVLSAIANLYLKQQIILQQI